MTLTALATAEPPSDSGKPFYLVPDVGTEPDDFDEIKRLAAEWFERGTALMARMAAIGSQVEGTQDRKYLELVERIDSQENDLKELHVQLAGLEESES